MSDADWNDSDLGAVAVLLNGAASRAGPTGDLLIVFNAADTAVQMRLPAPPQGTHWARQFDTSAEQPFDDELMAPCFLQRNEILEVNDRSVVLLESRPT
jgi:pullulanase/glycogen debranching enzyme